MHAETRAEASLTPMRRRHASVTGTVARLELVDSPVSTASPPRPRYCRGLRRPTSHAASG